MKNGNAKYVSLLFPIMLSITTMVACSASRSAPSSPAPISLARLLSLCGDQIPCDQAPPCLGKTIAIEGLVDQNAIFGRHKYPHLPYEKFLLTDSQGRSIEIWAQSKNNQPIFDKLAHRPDDHIMVTGRLSTIKLPIGNRCHWGLKVVIHEPSQIQY